MPQINGKCQVLSLAFCFSVFMALVAIRDMPSSGTSTRQPQVVTPFLPRASSLYDQRGQSC